MDLQAYIEQIKLELSGGLLELEITDDVIAQVVNMSLREIQRYITTTRLATIEYKSCIDLSKCGVSSVTNVYRAKGYLASDSTDNASTMFDPMYAAQWQLLGGVGGMWNMTNWSLNYGAWNTMLQTRNTVSTDLIFRFDKSTSKLYINVAFDKPNYITIEYIPRYDDVSQVVSDYWIDELFKLALARCKVILGRIRSKFTQSNALWVMDGPTMLEEGNKEYEALRTHLEANSQLCYPID